jgi:hypothetical protein
MATTGDVSQASEGALVATQDLPRDLAIMRMENDNIQALAAARPRDHAVVLAEMQRQIEAYPSFAKAAIYNKPVGKDPDTGIMKYARGLSIRAAEGLAEAYGYCRVRADVEEVDDNKVKIEASFTDYQKGRIWQDAGFVSKYYKTKNGGMRRLNDDRFYNVVVKAEKSKLIREVICRSVPPGLRSEVESLAEEMIDRLLDDKTMDKVVAAFATIDVTLEQLERVVGRTRKAGWTKEDRRLLQGIWTAIDSEETTKSEVFGESTVSKPEKPSGPVTGDSLTQGKTEPEPDNAQLIDEYRQLIDDADGDAEVLGAIRKEVDADTRLSDADRKRIWHGERSKAKPADGKLFETDGGLPE